MDLVLTRFYKGEDCTLGALMDKNKFLCFTLEFPWLDNKGFVSCVPKGIYNCVPHNGLKYKNVWRLDKVVNRSGILIHNGNTVDNTSGCILVGNNLGTIKGKKAVINSVDTLNFLREYIGISNKFTLTIKDIENV